MRLARDAPVLLITKDRGFVEGREYGKGLAENLKREAVSAANGISISHESSTVLERVRATVPVNFDDIEAAVLNVEKRADLARMLGVVGYTLGERIGVSHLLFATDNPNEALIEFSLTFRALHPEGRGGQLTVRGEGRYGSESGEVGDIRPRGDDFVYTDETGEQKKANQVLLAGSAHIGHRVIQHDVRVPL